METTAHVTISTEKKLSNLAGALWGVENELRKEGRYVASDIIRLARYMVGTAEMHYKIQTPGHD